MVNKYSAFYRTQKFVTMFITAHHWTVSWAS